MIGSRAWCALMRRNWIYRKRNYISSFFELILPMLFVVIVISMKRSHNDNGAVAAALSARGNFIPQNNHTYQPFSYTDIVTALQAQRVCKWVEEDDEDSSDDSDDDSDEDKKKKKKKSHFEITGIYNRGDNWQVPFIKCDSRKCEYTGQDAQPFCEYHILGVASSSDNSNDDDDDGGGKWRALDFRNYLYRRFPVLANTNNNNNNENERRLPFDFDFVRLFDSQAAMDEYVTSPYYGTNDTFPKLALGIVFHGNRTDHYDYSIRQNSTNYNAPEQQAVADTGGDTGGDLVRTTPRTDKLFDDKATHDFHTCNLANQPKLGVLGRSCTGQYMYNGVLATQRVVGDYIHNATGVTAAGYGVAAVQFVQFPITRQPPQPKGFFQTLDKEVPLLLALGMLYTVAVSIRYIVSEKELRQKELLKMMSVVETDIGCSWLVTFLLGDGLAATIASIATIFLFPYSSFGWLWLFWMTCLTAMTLFAMALAACFSKAVKGVLLGLLVYLMGFFLFLVFDAGPIVTLHPVATFCYGIKLLGYLADADDGLTSETMQLTTLNTDYTFATVMVWFGKSMAFWTGLMFYLNRVIRPDYGQALPLWFPLLPSYWRSCLPSRWARNTANSSKASSFSMTEAEDDGESSSWGGEDEIADGDDDDNGETIPIEQVGEAEKRQKQEGRSIEIQNLKKTFGDKTAVDGLTLSMYSGQITALLGHNGAGKTTTINMLTGAMAPTSGTAYVAGKDIRTQMPEIRADVGVCMQHDCLFPQLTVREHVEFFSRLKGLYSEVSKEEADKHVNDAIEDVALMEKRNTLSQNLSGGMKRKLSVAIAFCGGSKVVILDEPTSGMDPYSRRFTWSVIRHYRQNRCIILTTHFMDEADILGDRVAIMSAGKLRCCGSSLFLKKCFGVGYRLTIEKNQEKPHMDMHSNDTESLEIVAGQSTATPAGRISGIYSDSDKLKQIVVEGVEEAKLLSDVGSELSYQLPLHASSQFIPMFERLDEEVENGTISCYGVSITTLDEVFLKVTGSELPEKTGFASAEMRSSNLTQDNEVNNEDANDRFVAQPEVQLDDDGLFCRHLKTLLKKRASIFRRDKKAWLFTTILPSLFVLLGFVLFYRLSPNRNLEPVTMDLNDYNREFKKDPLRNPINVNSPGNPYLCQPGICSHREPVVMEDLTNETYFFCGFLAKQGLDPLNAKLTQSNLTCSISESTDIVNAVSQADAFAADVDVGNITESSTSLMQTSDAYAASQYAAIWFTHENDSIMSDGKSYRESVVGQCEAIAGSGAVNYTDREDCKYYGGLGYVVQYNYTARHVAVMYQSTADEAIVRHATGNSDFTINTTIAPLPVTSLQTAYGKAEDSFAAWFLVVLSFPFISGAFATFIVTERYSKAKHLQTVAGVEPSAYWLSTFFWDVCNYQIPLWITVGLMFAFDIDVLTTNVRDAFSGVVVLLFLYGPASAGFTYCVSFAFKSASLCNMAIVIMGFLIGMGGSLTCHVLLQRSAHPFDPKPSLATLSTALAWILRINPTFSLAYGLFNVINVEEIAKIESDPDLTVWSPAILRTDVCVLALQCFVYLVLAIRIDKWSTNPRFMSTWRRVLGFSCCIWRQKTPMKEVTVPMEDDDDVLAEEELVLSGAASGDLIVLKQLTKVYDNGKVAVDKLSLGVGPGECFGLLGVNGAGKTTTMSMITAEFPPTSGDAFLAGFSVTQEPQKIRRRIGYCPQFDALFENMTGREHVELYASIKGIPTGLVKAVADAKLSEVGLSDSDRDRLSSGYSGGMKRRLSLACATVGQPQLVFLDECSTGVDPVARREIWQLVSDIVTGRGLPASKRPGVILTTHSMEECEALCPRIGIMANGRLRCLGSAQHLKTKFGKGFQLELKVQSVSTRDDDYMCYVDALENARPASVDEMSPEDEMELGFTVDQTKRALHLLCGDNSLAKMIEPDDPIAFSVWKDATSEGGIQLRHLAMFVATEKRLRKLDHFISKTFPERILRERQDAKARYEVNSTGLKLSSIFATIEENKERLLLSDYSVSQTSLEQVFNLHAAEAEQLKYDSIDG